jgi:aminopeptidase N
VRRNPAGDPGAPLRLDGEALDLVSITLDGAPLGANRYRVEDGQLVIPEVPDVATVEIETRIAPKDNTRLTGLHVANGSFFTQCEAEGFRRITYFPALVAGDMVSVNDSFTTRSGRDVALAIWVRRGDEDRCGHAMRSLKRAMMWDEETFGREYDLDLFNIAAACDFLGAMENKGLNIFNTKYVLARPETATDADYQGIETVIAHEYFHNWTGNRVTGRDWFQLSLKEGLTVYRDQVFTADRGSRAVKRIHDVRALRAMQFREDASPLAHPVQPDRYIAIGNFYTATVYTKGAEVIRMIATIIGRPAFRSGMDLYFARHDGRAVTVDDFVQAMQDASGVDLTRFKRWYHQAGTPELDVADEYDPATQRWTLILRQTTRPTPGQPEKQPLVIPVALGLLDDQGRALSTLLAGEAAPLDGTRVVLAAQAETRFVFEDVPSLPTPSLLRGFSAPVKLFGVSPERLRLLAAHDSDPFVRWESGQQYAAVRLLEMAAAWRSGAAQPPVDPGLIEAASATLATADADPAFAAAALMLPSESFLADAMTITDVDAIHAVRDSGARGDRRGDLPRVARDLRPADRSRPVPDRGVGDRRAGVAQRLPWLPGCRWRYGGRRPGQGTVRRRAEHDRRVGRARRAGRGRLP